MKIYTMVLALVAAAPAVAASGYNYNTTGSNNGYYTSSNRTTSTSRSSDGYRNAVQNNFGGSQTTRSSSYNRNPYYSSYDNGGYNNYNSNGYVTREKQVTTRTYSSQERKYFLAHPFFQPLKGKFGSVTDFAYAANNFKFDILNGTVYDIASGTVLGSDASTLKGKAETTQFLIKEDFSFGLSDTLAIIGMVQYDSTKVTFKDWADSADPTFSSPSDSYSSSGLNLFGIGLQNRFVDSDEWIAMIAGHFEHQKDVANTFFGEVKAGYKINRTTVYGLLRAGYSVLTKGDAYGSYVEKNGDYMMLSYNTDVRDIFSVEGGMGVFAVLNKDFTLNGELLYGHYDWHNQLSIKGAIGWQPQDMFALNLYASTSLYDSGKGKTRRYMQYDVNPEAYTGVDVAYTVGDYELKNYNEWKIGVQAILYF